MNGVSLQLRWSKLGTDLLDEVENDDGGDIVQDRFEVIAGKDSRVLATRDLVDARVGPVSGAFCDRRRGLS